MTSSWIVTNLEIFAKMREAVMEATFLDVYGSPVLQAAVGVKAERQRNQARLAGCERRDTPRGTCG